MDAGADPIGPRCARRRRGGGLGGAAEVSGQFVTFGSTTVFRRDDIVIESTSTRGFRDRTEVEDSLVEAGFQILEIRDAPDRPGLEFVFIAIRPQ